MEPVKIFYWPCRGRAGATILMMEHAGIAYEHKSEFSDIATVASAFGGPNDTFAPPIVQDGPNFYSQSTTLAMWAGRKAGLLEGVDELKAMQVRPIMCVTCTLHSLSLPLFLKLTPLLRPCRPYT